MIDSWAWVNKSDLGANQLEALRKALTIVPRKVGDHPGDAPSPISLFSETSASFGMPRQFFLKRRKPAHEVEMRVSTGDMSLWPGPLKLVDGFTLREEQARAKVEVVGLLRGGSLGGIVRASPGWGKTVFACALMEALQVPTLVVVHKEFLMDQWKERIASFLPNAKIGTVQGPTLDFKGRHVAVGMVHSLSGKDYGDELKKWPGLVITDEVHRIGAETWSSVPAQFNARWRVGLSATPRRKDGAEDVFRFHIGEVIFNASEQRMKPKIRRVWTGYRPVQTNNFNPSLLGKNMILKFMCANSKRNTSIIEQVILAVKTGRKCLVLSERLQHLRDMETLLLKLWKDSDGAKPSIGYYIGGQQQGELAEAAKQQVILATSQLVQEGLDIPSLDTLFLTTPLSDIEQAAGRILRPSEGKKEPIIVDFRDDEIGLCRRFAEFRDKQYERIA